MSDTFVPMSFVADELLTSTKMNLLATNLDGLHSGAAIADDAIESRHLDWSSGIIGEVLGSTTLSVAGDALTVNSIPDRDILFVVVEANNSGALSCIMRFNGDDGNNYAYRVSGNGSADSSNPNVDGFFGDGGSYNIHSWWQIVNNPAKEKGVSGFVSVANSVGPGSVPSKNELAGKWANTSDPISRIDYLNLGAGSFEAGSKMVVTGFNI